MAASGRIVLGEIRGLFGVKGWVRVQSHTEPATNILDYSPWRVFSAQGERRLLPLSGRWHGPGLIVQLGTEDGGLIADRAGASALIGSQIEIERQDLPPAPEGEVYWADLEGLEVRGSESAVLGRVARVISTPAHPVLEVQGPGPTQLIPFVRGPIVTRVDLEAGYVQVEWAADYAD